jgi:hypothetical protein
MTAWHLVEDDPALRTAYLLGWLERAAVVAQTSGDKGRARQLRRYAARLGSELVKGRAPEGRLPPPSAVAGESGQRLGSPVGYPNNAVAAVEE